MLSRSCSSHRGAESSGKALTNCCADHAEVGCSVTLTCTMRRRSCAIRTSTKSTRPVNVETVKKSIETMAERWLARKVHHGWDGGRDSCASSRDTVRSEISMPSFPELAVDTRGAPQRVGAGHVGEESGDVRIERGPTGA